MKAYIYGLVDPRNQQLRYVGVTKAPERRRRAHRCLQHTADRRASWLKALRKQGLKAEWFVIEEVDESEWQEAERFWISYFRYIGAELFNHVDGGRGTLNPTAEVRAKISAKAKGRAMLEKTRLKISESLKGRIFSEAECKKHSENTKRIWEQRDEQERRRIGSKASASKKGTLWSEERKRERADLMKRKAKEPAYHAQLVAMARKSSTSHKGIPRSQELKEKVSKTLTGRNLSEEHKRHITEGLLRFHGK